MNPQVLQLIQKVRELEDYQSSLRLKVKTLETQVNDLNISSHHTKTVEPSFPKGTILLFSGEKIPPGWVICDGNNQTPNISVPFTEDTEVEPIYIMKQT